MNKASWLGICVVVVLFVLGGLVALVSSDSGGSSPSPGAGRQSHPLALARSVLARSAYVKSFQNCILREFRRRGAARLAVIDGLPAQARERRILLLMTKVEPRCTHPGEAIVDPSATQAQIASVRTRLADSFSAVLRAGSDVGRGFQVCALTQIKRMPDTEVVAMANGTSSEQHRMFARLLGPCTSE